MAADALEKGKFVECLRGLKQAEKDYNRALTIVPLYAKVRLNLWDLQNLRAEVCQQQGLDKKEKECLLEAERQIQQAERD